jgi:hypothetical protein
MSVLAITYIYLEVCLDCGPLFLLFVFHCILFRQCGLHEIISILLRMFASFVHESWLEMSLCFHCLL